MFLRLHIQNLTADHAVHAGRTGKHANRAQLYFCRNTERIGRIRCCFKREIEQTVTCEHCDRFAVNLVIGGLAAAQIVIIHARQIVMDEGVGVNHLERTGERQCGFNMAATQTAEFQHKRGTQPFSARHR